MFDLTGKNALVTGASGGIGGAIARALHGAGATVALSGTRTEPLEALAQELGEQGKGVYITQVVPFPWDTSNPLVAAYHAALKANSPDEEPGFVSFEGYIVGRLMVSALDKAGPDVTRESFLNTVYSTGEFDLNGVKLTFGEGDNQGMDEIFMTVIEGPKSFTPIGAGT